MICSLRNAISINWIFLCAFALLSGNEIDGNNTAMPFSFASR